MRFRGEVVTSFVSRGWPGNTLDIEGEQLTLRTFFSEPVVVRRQDVDAVEFRRMRLPFLWCTFMVIRRKGGYLPEMFVSLRSSKL